MRADHPAWTVSAVVPAAHARLRRPRVRTAGPSVRPGGPRARRSRGHARGRQGGRDPPQVAGGQVAGLRALHRWRWVGRSRRPDRPDRLRLGSTVRWPARVGGRRVLVACGAAGGIAATFNAPLAGVFFAMELILRDFTTESFGMVALSRVTACALGRAALGNPPVPATPGLSRRPPRRIPAVRGASAPSPAWSGSASPGSLYPIEDLCDCRLAWARMAPTGSRRAGCWAGCCWYCRRCTASATRCSSNAMSGRYVIGFLLELLAGKMRRDQPDDRHRRIRWGSPQPRSLALCSAPRSAWPLTSLYPPDRVGGRVRSGRHGRGLRGAARAPITAVIIMFELTGEYRSSCR